jgi:hypothetical protein
VNAVNILEGSGSCHDRLIREAKCVFIFNQRIGVGVATFPEPKQAPEPHKNTVKKKQKNGNLNKNIRKKYRNVNNIFLACTQLSRSIYPEKYEVQSNLFLIFVVIFKHK